jgi:hypothetical protein
MNENEAKLKLFIMNSKAQSYDKTDAFVFLQIKVCLLNFRQDWKIYGILQ